MGGKRPDQYQIDHAGVGATAHASLDTKPRLEGRTSERARGTHV